MPQASQNLIAVNPSGVNKPLNLDSQGRLKVDSEVTVTDPITVTEVANLTVDAQGALKTSGGGSSTALNVSASTAIKASAGRCITVNVLVAGAAGAIHDCAATGDAASGNKVAVIPATVGTYRIDWPCATGIVYVPGASQVVSISYN